MARYTGPKCRLCRREGEKLYLKGNKCFTSKCPFERRRYPPGMHGPSRRRRRESIYGMQLREKQKVRRIYGVLEGPFRRYFEEARRMGGNAGENLLTLLERRLDNVVYRLGFAVSRAQARQFVRHGHILVNGRRVDIPSYQVRPGDVIEVHEKFRNNPILKENLESVNEREVVGWLSLVKDEFRGTVERLPVRADITHPINERLIIELYSK
ncbi:MAG: 30S ribosomal protein S4 [Candidatus Hydrothermae bacterium]|nr:30S ribosomal protein S4 [Candidatus Hydrothermae bacterium]